MPLHVMSQVHRLSREEESNFVVEDDGEEDDMEWEQQKELQR